jgi:hypothetical protein
MEVKIPSGVAESTAGTGANRTATITVVCDLGKVIVR